MARYARALALVVVTGPACGDDTPVTTGGSSSTSAATEATDTTSPPPDTGSTTAVADDTATGTSSTGSGDNKTTSDTTTGDTDTTTGGEVLPGRTMSQLVSSGERASNRNFTLVYTFGQPSSLQSTHTSANFRLQGGLIGANGSPP